MPEHSVPEKTTNSTFDSTVVSDKATEEEEPPEASLLAWHKEKTGRPLTRTRSTVVVHEDNIVGRGTGFSSKSLCSKQMKKWMRKSLEEVDEVGEALEEEETYLVVEEVKYIHLKMKLHW